MLVKAIIDERFDDYKKPSMFIATCFCNWKCCIEGNYDLSVCQNYQTLCMPNIEISNQEILDRYKRNSLTSAIVIGGLEPFFQISEIYDLICLFRQNGIKDEFVIYTGYYPDEVANMIDKLKKTTTNIIIKFGRYIKDKPSKYDKLLGVTLASDNQFAIKIC